MGTYGKKYKVYHLFPQDKVIANEIKQQVQRRIETPTYSVTKGIGRNIVPERCIEPIDGIAYYISYAS